MALSRLTGKVCPNVGRGLDKMNLNKFDSVVVEISNAELEKIVLDYLYRKHADLKGSKWELEDFSIHFSGKAGDNEKIAVNALYTRYEPIEGIFRDDKCFGCSNCSNTICR